MTDLDDLIARLRMDVRAHEITHNGNMKRVQAIREAIAALASLRDEVARKDAALRGLMRIVDDGGRYEPEVDAARAALAPKE